MQAASAELTSVMKCSRGSVHHTPAASSTTLHPPVAHSAAPTFFYRRRRQNVNGYKRDGPARRLSTEPSLSHLIRLICLKTDRVVFAIDTVSSPAAWITPNSLMFKAASYKFTYLNRVQYYKSYVMCPCFNNGGSGYSDNRVARGKSKKD